MISGYTVVIGAAILRTGVFTVGCLLPGISALVFVFDSDDLAASFYRGRTVSPSLGFRMSMWMPMGLCVPCRLPWILPHAHRMAVTVQERNSFRSGDLGRFHYIVFPTSDHGRNWLIASHEPLFPCVSRLWDMTCRVLEVVLLLCIFPVTFCSMSGYVAGCRHNALPSVPWQNGAGCSIIFREGLSSMSAG